MSVRPDRTGPAVALVRVAALAWKHVDAEVAVFGIPVVVSTLFHVHLAARAGVLAGLDVRIVIDIRPDEGPGVGCRGHGGQQGDTTPGPSSGRISITIRTSRPASTPARAARWT